MGFGKRPQFFKGEAPALVKQDSSEFEITVAQKTENDEDRWADEDLKPKEALKPKKEKPQ